jgi:hypothetical protein
VLTKAFTLLRWSDAARADDDMLGV